MFTLASDGSAETRLGESECYPGTWGFGAPNKLLVRVVIPLNIPDVDDELNATEMGFTIHTFSQDSFTAAEFDRDKRFHIGTRQWLPIQSNEPP